MGQTATMKRGKQTTTSRTDSNIIDLASKRAEVLIGEMEREKQADRRHEALFHLMQVQKGIKGSGLAENVQETLLFSLRLASANIITAWVVEGFEDDQE